MCVKNKVIAIEVILAKVTNFNMLSCFSFKISMIDDAVLAQNNINVSNNAIYQ